MSTNPVVLSHGSLPTLVRNGTPAEPLELVLYWRTIYRRKWWIIAAALLCAAITALGVSFITPTYRATVTLMIEQNKAKLVSIDEVYSGVSPNREHYQTQAEMLKSPALAMAVIRKLDLLTHPEFDPRRQKQSFWNDLMPRASSKSRAEWSEEKVEAAVLAEFLRRITIEPVRLSQLVKLGFDSADPGLAARIANAIAEAYLKADIEMRATVTEKAGDWLADRLAGLKQNLEDSERGLQQFREREGLLDIRGLTQGGATVHLEQLARASTETKQRRLEAEHNYEQIKRAADGVGSLPLILRSSLVDQRKNAEAEAERRYAMFSRRYGRDHPRLMEAERDLKEKREQTQHAIQQVIASFAKEYETATANERAVERSLMAAKGSIQQINRKEFQLDALERDVATNRQLYERFLNRYRETRAAGDTKSSVVARIIDPAIAPEASYKPRKYRMTMIGFVLGLILAAIAALLRERVDNTIKSGDEVEEKLGVPTLAVLPLLAGPSGVAVGRHYLEQPSSVFSEAIRTARTSLLLSAIDLPNKVLLVTSSVPNEGKSAFAINLALAHAQTKKVLLLEGDLRRPSIARHLGLDETKPGLTSLFTDTSRFADCLQRVEGSSLYVLPAGSTATNPLELLSSDRFRLMIDRIAAACDIVIIDSPPVHLVSDSVLLSTIASAVLFVVKAEHTPYPLARRCVRTLQEAGGSVVGAVLNQLDFNMAARYYGSYTGYSKEYGYSPAQPARVP